jgi:hypothetical protein
MRIAVLVAALAFSADPPAKGDPFPPIRRGDLSAHLSVHTAEKGPQPGLALVDLTISVTGSPDLEVEPPRLLDSTAAWFVRRTEWAAADGDRVTWTERLRLTQTKPGPTPLPDVKVRFRDGAAGTWEKAEWVDLLKEPRSAPGVEAQPSTFEWPWQIGAAAAGAVGLLLVLGSAWYVSRRRPSARPPSPPDQWALSELTRIEQTVAPPAGDSERYHTLLSNVVRRYLAERFGLSAPRQTTAEFLKTLRASDKLPPDQQAMLRDFLEQCDLAKFARAPASSDDCRRAAELARAVVRQTTSLVAAPTTTP